MQLALIWLPSVLQALHPVLEFGPMITLLSAPLLVASVVVMVAALVLFIEILVAVEQPPDDVSDFVRRPVLVLIPAHDEGSAILPTLADVKAQLKPGDRLLVVADNCSDNTAEIAEAAGAEVLPRNDPERRGKSFALDFGFQSLAETDPHVIIVIDADCRVEEGAIDQLARACTSTGGPAQALYLMTATEDQSEHLMSEFAWRVKNELRPRGLQALGLPCQLMGSGMAFPRELLKYVNVASGHLAEDLELGLQLAAAGHAPTFCPTARVTSHFPSPGEASLSQRRRWEHGHLSVVVRKVVPCLLLALRTANWPLLALSLDAAIPPVVLLGFLILLALAAGFLFWIFGGEKIALIASAGALATIASSLILAWTKCARDRATVPRMVSILPYVTNKWQIYRHAWVRDKKWIRTDRGNTL
jgi:cellulose synthase/poly-beta-1,6-N-acetylglucosamine synthase-like glycosyltransferase